MTLQEAVKTGRPFKRVNDPRWILWGRPKKDYVFTIDEVMAEDWIVQEGIKIEADPNLDPNEWYMKRPGE